MSEANEPDSTRTSRHALTIGDVEPLLHNLEAEIEILHHLSTSRDQVDQGAWARIEEAMLQTHGEIHEIWYAAFQQHNEERNKAEATLAAAKVERAVPGSKADLETVNGLRALLHAAADVVMRKTAPPPADGICLETANLPESSEPVAAQMSTAPAVVGETSPDAELLRLYTAFLHAHADHKGANVSAYFTSGPKENKAHDKATDEALDGWWELAEKIHDTPATTLPGLYAKADAMRIVLEGTVMVEAGSTIADLGEDQEFEARFAWSLARDVVGVATSHAAEAAREGLARRDHELIRLCDRLVEINAAEKKIHEELGEDDAVCDAALKPWSDEWKSIEQRVLDLGKPTTLAGAVAMARAAPLNVNTTPDGGPMSYEFGEHMLLAVCAYLTNDERPYFQPAEASP